MRKPVSLAAGCESERLFRSGNAAQVSLDLANFSFHGFHKMIPLRYNAHVSRLIGPEKSTFLVVQLRPTDHQQGEVAGETIRVMLREDQDTNLDQVTTKARALLAAVSGAEWLVGNGC